ncbi:MAG TPA: hemolysin III family protein, partial [Pseudoxanthomonas sp.]|nr:hemolysin III family protein [Pseudoxanthomonas sp.]
MAPDATPRPDLRNELASALTHGLGAMGALAGGAVL